MRAADVRSRKETDDIKEEASQRTIKLDAETLTLLAALKRERKVVSMNGSSLVFNIGGRVLRANAVRISLNKSLKKAGLDHIRIHDLRHGAGSILLDTGKSLADVAEFLGHSSPATTAAAYTHAVRQGESIGNLLPK